MNGNIGTELPVQTLKRLPYYLQYLRELREQNIKLVASPAVAAYFKSTEIQVRKDFAAVCPSGGKPRQGFSVDELIEDIEDILGYNNVNEAVLAGAGSLGHALISYRGFADYGLKIVAAFDSDPALTDSVINGVKVLPAEKMSELCRRMRVHIGIITVPQSNAQQVCDSLIDGGVLAIWNFSTTHLIVPDGVLVQNENMAASLALLSRHLNEKLNTGKGITAQ